MYLELDKYKFVQSLHFFKICSERKNPFVHRIRAASYITTMQISQSQSLVSQTLCKCRRIISICVVQMYVHNVQQNKKKHQVCLRFAIRFQNAKKLLWQINHSVNQV